MFYPKSFGRGSKRKIDKFNALSPSAHAEICAEVLRSRVAKKGQKAATVTLASDFYTVLPTNKQEDRNWEWSHAVIGCCRYVVQPVT